MAQRTGSTIKRSQKEQQLYRELAQLFRQVVLDHPALSALTLNRVQLSSDKSHCTAFFYTPDGEAVFHKLMETLILYKPSIRKALSQKIAGRYTPELVFRYDSTFEKQQHIEKLIDSVAHDKFSHE